jgi:hypothetical protein
MIVIARTELARCTKEELDGLFALISNRLACTEHGSPEWQSVLATLDNIRSVKAARNVAPRPRGPGF